MIAHISLYVSWLQDMCFGLITKATLVNNGALWLTWLHPTSIYCHRRYNTLPDKPLSKPCLMIYHRYITAVTYGTKWYNSLHQCQCYDVHCLQWACHCLQWARVTSSFPVHNFRIHYLFANIFSNWILQILLPSISKLNPFFFVVFCYQGRPL